MIQKHYSWRVISFFIFLSIFLLSEGELLSQTKIQVITKTISKKIPYAIGKTIKIVGEKAAIDIESWDKDYISVNIYLIAKHPDKKTAEDDIRFIDYKVAVSTELIEISNFFSQKTGYKDIKSNLMAKFEIKVPSPCSLSMVDVYGSVSLKNIKGKIGIDINFAQLNLINIEGDLNVKSHYGDIDAENINAILTLKSEMADLTFRNLLGACLFETNYGNFNITPNEKMTSLKVDANRTTVQLIVNNINAFSFKIETQNGDITISKIIKKQVLKNLFNEQFIQVNDKPLIQVNGKYSSITLKND